MYTQHGELDGVKWLSEYLGGRTFMLYVGELSQPYTCEHEPIFGVDGSDYAAMNEIMDNLHDIYKESNIINNDIVENRLTLIEEKKSRLAEESRKKSELAKIKLDKEIVAYLENKEEDTVSGLMYEFSAGIIDYKEMIDKMSKVVSRDYKPDIVEFIEEFNSVKLLPYQKALLKVAMSKDQVDAANFPRNSGRKMMLDGLREYNKKYGGE